MTLYLDLDVSFNEVVVSFEGTELCTVEIETEYYEGYEDWTRVTPDEPSGWYLTGYELPKWLEPFEQEFEDYVCEIINEWEKPEREY